MSAVPDDVIDDARRFSVGDEVKLSESFKFFDEWRPTKAVVIGVAYLTRERRVGYTILHDGNQVTDEFDASDLTLVRAARPAAPATDAEVERHVGFDVMLAQLRDEGWAVAVHNDYRLNGEPHTFWLFTRSDGRWIKGEGRTDDQALSQALAARPARAPHAVEETARPSAPPVAEAREEMIKRIAAEDWLDTIYAKALDRAVIGPDALSNRERIVAFLETQGAMLPAERQRLRAETEASR